MITIISALLRRWEQRKHHGNGLHLFLREGLRDYNLSVTERMDVFRVFNGNRLVCRIWYDRNDDCYKLAA